MFVPHWLYLGILLLLAIFVPLVIIRVLRHVFATKQNTGGKGRRSCLGMAGFLVMFLALGFSLAFYFPKTEIRTIEADGAISSRTVILYPPSNFVDEHHLSGFSFDSVYVANESDSSIVLLPQDGRTCDTLSIPAGAVIPVAKTSVSAYFLDFAPQSQK